MKEFKYCHEYITEGVEIPVTVCETQKEMVAELVMQKEYFDFAAIRMNEVEEKRINGYYNLTDGILHEYAYREAMKEAISGTDEEMMYIIYKDGSEYWNGADEVHGKFKRYGIKRAIISTPWGYTVFGDFAINDMGDVTIEEREIEEYGVYAGQYDVKEQDEQEVQEVSETETNETTAERQKDEVRTMKYTMQELKDIYFEAKDRFGYVEDEDIMGYENIAKKAERVLTGKTKFCRFNICEKDTISAMFTEDDDACIINDTYDEYVKCYGDHAELVMKMYGVKKTKAQTAETAVTEEEQSEKAETVEQTEVEETAETETAETAEQTQADEAAVTEPAKTPKSENVPYKMKWTNQNVDYSRANYTAVIFKFNNSKVWLQSDCVCSTQTARAIIRKLGKRFGSKSVDVKYFSDTNEKIVSVCQLYDNSGYIFRNEIAVKNGEKRQFIKYAAKEIFE